MENLDELLKKDAYHQMLEKETDGDTQAVPKIKLPYSVKQALKRVHRTYEKLKDGIPDYTFCPVGTGEEFIITRNGYIYPTSMYSSVKYTGSANGYPRVELILKDGSRKTWYKHRLLALSYRDYINDPYKDEIEFDKLTVNHIDGNKTHCYITDLNGKQNLEIVTVRDNTVHAYKNNLIKANRLCRPVVCIDPDTNEIIQEFPSINAAAKETGCSQPQLSRLLKGDKRYKTAGGYKWQYK